MKDRAFHRYLPHLSTSTGFPDKAAVPFFLIRRYYNHFLSQLFCQCKTGKFGENRLCSPRFFNFFGKLALSLCAQEVRNYFFKNSSTPIFYEKFQNFTRLTMFCLYVVKTRRQGRFKKNFYLQNFDFPLLQLFLSLFRQRQRFVAGIIMSWYYDDSTIKYWKNV